MMGVTIYDPMIGFREQVVNEVIVIIIFLAISVEDQRNDRKFHFTIYKPLQLLKARINSGDYRKSALQ